MKRQNKKYIFRLSLEVIYTLYYISLYLHLQSETAACILLELELPKLDLSNETTTTRHIAAYCSDILFVPLVFMGIGGSNSRYGIIL